METNKEFNYFYFLFQDIFHKKANVFYENTSSNQKSLYNVLYLLTDEEKKSIFEQTFWEVCSVYVALSKTDLKIFPNEPMEFVSLLLETMTENPFKESFLNSLMFIYQDYLGVLEVGFPILFSSESEDLQSLYQITLNSHYDFLEFEAINMDLLEEIKTMTKIVSMTKNKQFGPLPNTLIRIRKDI